MSTSTATTPISISPPSRNSSTGRSPWRKRFCSAPCSPKRSCAPTPPNANNGWRSTARKSMSRPAKPSPGRCSGRTTPTASRRTNANTTTSRAKPWPISTGGSTPPRTVSSYAAAASGSTNCRPSGPSRRSSPTGKPKRRSGSRRSRPRTRRSSSIPERCSRRCGWDACCSRASIPISWACRSWRRHWADTSGRG